MRGLVSWVSKTYHNISIIITENGVSDKGTTLQDDVRIDQIKVSLALKKKNLGSELLCSFVFISKWKGRFKINVIFFSSELFEFVEGCH